MRKYFLAGILIASLLVIYGYRLDFPAKEYYDEVYHVKTAREFIALSGNTDTTHPPLVKLFIAGAILIFGDHSWAWRLPSLLCGIGTLIVFFLLAEKFFKNTKTALFAAGLFALDGMSITQSRIAMLNTPMLLFMLLTVYFWARAVENKIRAGDFILTGIFLGLTAATRWVGIGVIGVLGILLVPHFSHLKNLKFLKNVFFFILIPAILVYFSTHLLFPFIKGYSWNDIWTYQGRMLHYHSTLKEGHAYGSSWWSWPVMTRPIWYLFERAGEKVYGILCIGNPVIFWMFFPVLGYLIWDLFKNQSRKTAFVLAGYFSQWLPWAFVGRVKFFHYYYAAMPFVILGLTLYLKGVWETGRQGRIFVMLYAVSVLAMFIYWYPLYVGDSISEAYFQNHLWFKTWI